MASTRSYNHRAPGAPQGWPVFVCHQGAFLFDPRVHARVDPEQVLEAFGSVDADPRRGLVALPACRDKDRLLPQPPLGLHLTQGDAEKLIDDTTGATGVLAATDMGPSGQDKGSNQDFALAATIRIPRPGGPPAVYQFAAVADGVTTRTFWPERTARLAVLAAWRVVRRHVEAHGGFSDDDVDRFRQALVRGIRDALEADMRSIAAAGDNLVPAGWARDTYHHFRGRRELWYNSTLLVAFVGAEAGMLAVWGDGGAVVRKSEDGRTTSTVLVRSTDDVAVSGVISLAADRFDFSPVRIALAPTTRLEIILSTDGVDRALRHDSDAADFDPYDASFSGQSSSQALNAMLAARLDQVASRDIDNISAAVLQWPHPRLPPLNGPRDRRAIAAADMPGDDIHASREPMRRSVLDGPVAPARPPGTTPRAVWDPPRRGVRDAPVPGREQARPVANVVRAIDQAISLSETVSRFGEHDLDAIFQMLRKATHSQEFMQNNEAGELTATCGKIIFLMFADRYAPRWLASRNMEDGRVDSQVDRFFLEKCGFTPTLSGRDIDVSKSYDFVGRFLALLRGNNFPKEKIEAIKLSFWDL